MTKFDEEAYRKIGQQIQGALYSTEDTRQDFRLRLSMLVECLANELARTDIEELGPIMDEFAEQIVQNAEQIRKEGQKHLFHFSRQK